MVADRVSEDEDNKLPAVKGSFKSVGEMMAAIRSSYTRWYYITLPFWRLWGVITRVWRKIVFRWERLIRGYSYMEVWNLCDYVVEFVLPRLKELRKNLTGYPAGMTQKEWEMILDKMIYAFESTHRGFTEDFSVEAFSKEDWAFEQERVQEGFELFGEYLLNLWD